MEGRICCTTSYGTAIAIRGRPNEKKKMQVTVRLFTRSLTRTVQEAIYGHGMAKCSTIKRATRENHGIY